MEQAAREHLERLGGQQQRGEDRVREPLQELAELHELMKDFNQFKQMFNAQGRLTEQTERFKTAEEITPADKMSLEEMAARQRGIGQTLEQLEDNLRKHADAAEGNFPKAAESARELADAMDRAAMPGLARNSSRSMLKGDGLGAHNRAALLLSEMARLFEAAGQPAMGQAQGGVDQALRLTRGMNPGNSFNQMMQSLNFGSGSSGASGAGQMGGMATGADEGEAKGLMGGESMMLGPIARTMRGQRGPNEKYGAPGGPSARIDGQEKDHGPDDSTRETSTPESQALLREYESLTDAYFHSLTNP